MPVLYVAAWPEPTMHIHFLTTDMTKAQREIRNYLIFVTQVGRRADLGMGPEESLTQGTAVSPW